jgi:hypothetical protein
MASKLTENFKKWRDSHKDEYNEYRRPLQRQYYNRHSEVMKKKRMNTYYFNKACMIFRNILIDP